jgi:hypothetical protein
MSQVSRYADGRLVVGWMVCPACGQDVQSIRTYSHDGVRFVCYGCFAASKNTPRFLVRHDSPDHSGCDYFSILDTRTGLVRATWTVGHYAASQAAWLNAHADTQPDTVVDAVELLREAAL